MIKGNGILPKIIIGVVGLITGSVLTSFLITKTEAQTSLKYSYFHFRAGSCNQKGDQGVIDLRNGNSWCVPRGSGAPVFEGTLNLSAISERPPTER